MTALRLGLVAVLAGSLAVAVLARPARTDPPQGRLATAYDVRSTTTPHTLVTRPDMTPVVLHRVALVTHCPRLAIEWSSTNVEPGTPGAWAVLELLLDGRVVQRGYFGAGTGVYEDGPARVVWSGAAPPGLHVAEARFSGGGPPGNWGMPYTNAPHVGLDLLLLREEPASGSLLADCAA
jgi:hypothetical protein